MTYKNFKIWLSGYLAGCGVEKVEDLEKHQLARIVEEFSKLEEDFVWPSTNWREPSSWMVTYPTDTTFTIENLINKALGK